MKRIFAILLCLSSLMGWDALGQDESYVQIYRLIQEGDQLNSGGQSGSAREKYLLARDQLKQLQTSHPLWNSGVIAFRLKYVQQQIDALGGVPVVSSEPTTAASPAAPEMAPDGQIRQLTGEVRRLTDENRVLHAKLNEALSAKPASLDPLELRRAEERIRLLEKEKELLKAALDREQAKAAPQADNQLVQDLRRALEDANQKLVQQSELAVTLAREKEILEARLQVARQENEELKSVRAAGDPEKKPITEIQLPSTTASSARLAQELSDAKASLQTQLTEVARLNTALQKLQSEKQALESTKKNLESQLASLPSGAAPPAAAETGRFRQVEQERDELLRKLNETTKQLYDNRAQTEALQKQEYENQLSALRSRLQVLEAEKVPYTPEELALFKQPQLGSAPVEAQAGKKSLRELPRGAGPLLADAERAFAARRFEEAEKKYLEVLAMDESNVFTLANLAASQLEQGKLDPAEQNLQRSLRADPSDGHSLSLLGILKFRQDKYEEALNALSRAAQLEPENPETQNYLGITLSQLGQRAPAETALRKAIQIAPGYGGAHHNLAVIYATQQPPFRELARWHYQKALASGHPQNVDLEKLIENTGGNSGN